MTREEDLIRIAKKLDKMVSRNNTEGAMDLLRELKGFNMTLRLLQETRIGMSVNGIRKHCTDEEVIALAKVLIKDWKRLLDSEKPSETKNGLDSSKTAASPNSSPSETKSSHRRLDVKPKHDSDPDKKHSNKYRKEKQNDEHKNKTERHADDLWDEKHLEEPQNEKHPQEIRKEKHLEELKKQKPAEDAQLELDNKKRKHVQDLQGEKHKPEPRKERLLEEPKKMRHVEEVKKEKHPEEPKKHSYTDDMKKDKHREESRHERPQRERPLNEKPADAQKPIFERRGVLDSTILYPTRFPSPPRPARPPPPIKRPSVDLKKDSFLTGSWPNRMPTVHDACCDGSVRKDGKDSSSRQPRPQAPRPASPPAKRPSLEVKKESRKESSDSKPPSQKKTSDHVKKDRKDSSDSKLYMNIQTEFQQPPKKPSVDVKKEKHRKDSCDSKPGQPVKRHSTDSKPDRRESTDSKKSSSPPAKKLTAERRESHSSKTAQPGPPQRKPSTDSIERKGKTDAPKTPTTPTSPMSPSFSSAGGPLPPHLATGDSVRDKCIEMLAAALRTDNDYKDFGTNCDSMAAEIEDHIYQDVKATDMKYKNRVRSRISNLKDPKNPGLRRNVLAGSIELSRIATMSAEEMASDELKQLRNVLTQEAIREHQMAKTGGTTTDLLQCGKCKKKNCTYNQVQTRSADEPMTTFVLCNECGNRWKFC
ncbi:transcription elongation factor A protein 3 isoform X11 [Siniperca chuatsi]|uniref:transcription elongation factor A protein 3 isoform X11 n=1 Tax=Siniperca chuatsi TaxID=119488 RepID=UPI001CE08F88|nr:transcription elongation factor A protein 3 isoform X11 [Siniperca chuatsi]